MKKKIISLVLSFTVLTTVLAGCSGANSNPGTDDGTQAETVTEDAAGAAEVTDEETDAAASSETSDIALDGTWPKDEVLIGVESFDTTDDQFLELREYFDYLEDYYNIRFMYSESIASAEDELNFISSCASAGAKAVIGYYNVTGVEAAQQANEQGMYYWASDINVYNELIDEEMYLGTYLFAGAEADKSGDYIAGYEMGLGLANAGVSHIVYCNGGAGFGVQMFIDRQDGFNAGVAAAQAEGAEVEYDPSSDVIEGWPGTDEFTAAQSSALASDYDGVGLSFNAATWIRPISDAGKSDVIKLATIGEATETNYDSINSGQLVTLVYDCVEVHFGHVIVSILNAVNGHIDMTRTEDGSAGAITVNRWIITGADEFNAIYDYHEEGKFVITAEDMTKCFPEFNAEASYDLINDFYSSYTLEHAMSIIE